MVHREADAASRRRRTASAIPREGRFLRTHRKRRDTNRHVYKRDRGCAGSRAASRYADRSPVAPIFAPKPGIDDDTREPDQPPESNSSRYFVKVAHAPNVPRRALQQGGELLDGVGGAVELGGRLRCWRSGRVSVRHDEASVLSMDGEHMPA
jgi:hypothetical protein